MRRILRHPDVQVWLGGLQPPYFFESPVAGDDFALLITWSSVVPKDFPAESFARTAYAAGARAIVVAGQGATQLAAVFEWVHASRFPNLEVPRSKHLDVKGIEITTDVAALAALTETKVHGARPTRFVLLVFGDDHQREASLETGAPAVFVPEKKSGVTSAVEPVRPVRAPVHEIKRAHDHSLYFETAQWEFSGTVQDARGEVETVNGGIQVELNAAVWNVDELFGLGRMRIRGTAPREIGHAAAWQGESDEFGVLHGHWAVVEDLVLTGFLRAGRRDGDSALIGSVVSRRLTPSHYLVHGTAVENGNLRAVWRGDLRRVVHRA